MKAAALAFTVVSSVLMVMDAHATTNWSRKYNVACTACHTVASMPRLNYYGEQFEHNGYQLPGEEDGSDLGKTAVQNTIWDMVENLVAFRFQMTPFRYTTNAATSNTNETDDAIDVGVVDHMNLFVAGSIIRNVGFYLNVEFPGSEDEPVFHKQFNLGWHNIAGSSWLNVKFGRLPPMQVSANSARAPMFPGIEIGQVFTIRTSGGKGDDSVNTRGGRPAAVVFGHGHAGPAYGYYSAGIEQGRTMEDPNTHKNIWGTIGIGAHEGIFEGSNISFFAYQGRDTKDALDAMNQVIGRFVNKFNRYVLSGNLRVGKYDLVASWLYGNERNFTLVELDQRRAVNYHGVVVMAGRPINHQWFAGAQYDYVYSNDALFDRFEFNKLTPSISYSPIDAIRILFMGHIDLHGAGGRDRNHAVFLTGRAML